MLVVGGCIGGDGYCSSDDVLVWSLSVPLRHDHGNGAAAVVLPSGEVLISGGAVIVPALNDPTGEARATIRVEARFDLTAP